MSQATSKSFHAFLTHNWSTNQDGCNNHEIVSKINKELQSYGVKTWFDEERMIGTIKKTMADGIEQSAVVVVFITQTYIDKVNQGNSQDNCYYEFGLADRRLGSSHMIPVCMEKRLQDPNTWTGIVGGSLGGNLYVDMTDHSNNAIFKQKCIELKNMILTIIGEDVSKHESQNNDLSVQVLVLEPMSSESCSLCSCFEGLFALRVKDTTYQGHTDVLSLEVLDSQTFLSLHKGAIKQWNIDQELCVRTYYYDKSKWDEVSVYALDSQTFILWLASRDEEDLFIEGRLELRRIGEDSALRTYDVKDSDVENVYAMDSQTFLCKRCGGALDLFKIDQELPLRTYTDVDSFGKLDSQTFISGKDHAIKLWKTYKDTAIRTYHLDARYRLGSIYVMDSQTFITDLGTMDYSENGFKVWKIDKDTALRTYHFDVGYASVGFCPLDSETFIAEVMKVSDEHFEEALCVKLWKTEKEPALHTYYPGYTIHDHSTLAKLDSQTFLIKEGKIITLWKIDQDSPLRTYRFDDWIQQVVVLDSQTFLSTDGQSIKLWNKDSRELSE